MSHALTTPTAKISARILALVATGVTPIDALRTICGADLVDRMIDELYTELRAQAVR